MTDEFLSHLAEEAWELHRTFVKEPWLVTPSAPILFFGDLTAYQASPLRIATVGLNPSRLEFPVGSPFSRLPDAQSSIPAYLKSLESYFRTAPYRTWFNSYEQALLGLDASYYGERPNTALHTDIGSVLPTDPTWSGLDRDIRLSIANSGVPLWRRLIAYLEPQIILWSTAGLWLDHIDLAPLSPWENIREFYDTKSGAPRKRSLAVRGRWYQLPNSAPVLIAFIPAAQTPLASLSHSQKKEAGHAILSTWRKGIE
jgi:hypothetical protein